MAKNQIITVFFKEIEIGKIGYDEDLRKASFQYNPSFLARNRYTHLFPYIIRKVKHVQVFTNFEGETFRGLPPMFADSLPDSFGNIVFKEWLEATHRDLFTVSPLEQLTYVGRRGMGALEYLPAKEIHSPTTIDVAEMTQVVRKVLDVKTAIQEKGLSDMALLNIFKIGTSAGGARPKILVSEHKITGTIVPGDLVYSADYNHYLIKLGIDDAQAYSKEKVEYVYYQLATATGIPMMPSKLIDDKHFATLRFDRQDGEKKHVLTASGLTGWDFNQPTHSSYENIFKLAIDLGVPHKDIQTLFRRMVFNVVFANIDDHLKNISFMYDDVNDKWKLAPAYDLTYPLDALKDYLRVARALSIQGKRREITVQDLRILAEAFTIKDAHGIIEHIKAQTKQFRPLCEALSLPNKVITAIEKEFNLLND